MAAEGYVATKRTRRRRRRRRSAAARLVLPLALLAVLAFGLAHLEAWPFRGLVTGLLRDEAGLEVSYERLGLGVLGGALEAEGVVIENPARFADAAPSFVTLGSLRGELDVAALLGGAVRLANAAAMGVCLEVGSCCEDKCTRG